MSDQPMYPRQNYEMSEDDLKSLLDAMKPQPVMKIGNHWTGDRQEAANTAWKLLGNKMGFVWDSCQPVAGKGMRHFSAIPSENEEIRAEREKQQAEEKRVAQVQRLKEEIEERQKQLAELSP